MVKQMPSTSTGKTIEESVPWISTDTNSCRESILFHDSLISATKIKINDEDNDPNFGDADSARTVSD